MSLLYLLMAFSLAWCLYTKSSVFAYSLVPDSLVKMLNYLTASITVAGVIQTLHAFETSKELLEISEAYRQFTFPTITQLAAVQEQFDGIWQRGFPAFVEITGACIILVLNIFTHIIFTVPEISSTYPALFQMGLYIFIFLSVEMSSENVKRNFHKTASQTHQASSETSALQQRQALSSFRPVPDAFGFFETGFRNLGSVLLTGFTLLVILLQFRGDDGELETV